MARLRLRSIRARGTVLVFAIAAAAVGGVYLYVVPHLRTRLVSERLAALDSAGERYGDRVGRTLESDLTQRQVRARVRAAAAATAMRVTLLRVGAADAQPQTSVVADSAGSGATGQLAFAPALAAARSGRPVTDTEQARAGGQWGEAARPFRFDGQVKAVTVFSAPLSDVQRTVTVVRRRILAAGGLALLFAILAGYVVARALSRRIQRLERAAEAITAGEFSRPIDVDSDDELGQLTLAFNEMQRQLSELDSARKRFIATASHELRTPLFSLGGFVELLEDEELSDEERARFLAQIGEQVERLRKLSVDLLDLSRLEAGSLELHEEPVDLAELSRSVAAEFEPALFRHDSHLELRFGRDPSEASTDPLRLAQLLRILIDNALTHTPPGTDIVVTTARSDGRLKLAVRDAGPGIPRTDMPRIFDPFFTSNDTRGSGLGLAIASELAERMDGSIGVESRPGRTTFTLELPVA